MKKSFSLLAAALLVCACLALSGCGAAALPGTLTEDDVTKAATDTVSQLNDKDYAALLASCGDTMTKALDGDALATAWEPFYAKAVTYSSITDTTVTASKGYAVAIVTAQYENAKAVFTLSYDADLKLEGLYFK